MTCRARRVGFAGLALLWALGACSFHGPSLTSGEPPLDPDAPAPVTCAALTCDPRATCLEAPARCECKQGYQGDGRTCADLDECAAGTSGCPAACANTDGGFSCYAPTTCEDVRAKVPGWTGGAVKLYAGGDPTKPWMAHCTADDREYLPLTQNNYSMYKGDPGEQDVVTTFTKIRIDPVTLVVDIADQSESTSTGTLLHGTNGPMVTKMPYAVAMDCRGSSSTLGRARIDLTGTPFVVNDQFSTAGAYDSGRVTTNDGGRTLDVTGGGYCGWNAPTGTPFDPYNTIASSPILQLAYRP